MTHLLLPKHPLLRKRYIQQGGASVTWVTLLRFPPFSLRCGAQRGIRPNPDTAPRPPRAAVLEVCCELMPYAAEPRLRTRIGVPRQTNPFPSQLANHRIGRSASRTSHTSGDRHERCQAAV